MASRILAELSAAFPAWPVESGSLMLKKINIIPEVFSRIGQCVRNVEQ
jgi:hypothetical protein